MEFYSHEGIYLEDHLTSVAKRMRLSSPDPTLDQLFMYTGLCHDFGKFTTYFQERLSGNNPKLHGDRGSHALLSAFFAAYVVESKFEGDNLCGGYHPLLVFNVTKSHHTKVQNPEKHLPQAPRGRVDPYFESDIKTLEIQISDLRENKITISERLQNFEILELFMKFVDEHDVIRETAYKLKRLNAKLRRGKDAVTKGFDLYMMHQFLFASLVSADKIVASQTRSEGSCHMAIEGLEAQRKKLISGRESPMNALRSQVFYEVMKAIDDAAIDTKIYTITSPTGSGKTFTGLFAAKRLQKKLEGDRKIIYALPFTSIIDQNYDVIRKLHGFDQHFEVNESNYLIKYHYLGELNYKSQLPLEAHQQAMLLDNWDSGIVVTTFVQLFQSVIGASNKMVMKFQSFKNSIILLDEVQAIDIRYHALIEQVLKKLTESLDCRIIMMTATKPYLLMDSTELLGNHADYFTKMDRTVMEVALEPVTVEGFLDSFLRVYDSERSYLIVCNTIGQSLDMFKGLSGLGKVYYLSTNLVPLHRKRVIESVKSDLDAGLSPILVSTQVIEAGVDLDFDIVVRDIAPIDAIVQCAGRCNRNNTKSEGTVRVVKIVDENGRSFSSKVYGPTDLVEAAFDGRKLIPESEYYDLIDSYFKLLKERKSQDDSKRFLKSIEQLNYRWDDPFGIPNFSLIKENTNYVDIVVDWEEVVEGESVCGVRDEQHQKPSEILCEIQRLLRQDKMENNMRIKRLNRLLMNYTISVPMTYQTVAESFEVAPGHIKLLIATDDLDKNYDQMTGLKREKTFDDYCF